MFDSKNRAEFLRYCDECRDQLRDSRHQFVHFLQLNDDCLWSNAEFIRYLVETTNELLERQEQLLEMARTLSQANREASGGSMANLGRAA